MGRALDPSAQALVLLFLAYVDSRQGFGPEGLREELAKQLLERQGAVPRSFCGSRPGSQQFPAVPTFPTTSSYLSVSLQT